MSQFLTRTPVYVWAILAFLVFRGVLATRDRDITMTRMTIIPLLMLVLALQSIGARYGLASVAMAAWLAGSAAVALQRWTFGGSRAEAGVAPGSLRMRGSWTPLLLMLAIFVIKYAMAVVQVVRPQVAASTGFALASCGLLGLCNGYFLGQLACDRAASHRILRQQQRNGAQPAMVDAV
ncbi:DUF6622 family protein [Massilia sp. IC2-476]|uniref:DUF6622 family protein n=1 Tax=Massilia sp. IC2-476 TaxID=2887199 RepID=UPI001D1029A5|nr:DUF6622 family protein [Massilia sp. IC2-476]MCC2971528.1 hypothetical protein [Massilia sp. IC2-476]